MKTQIIPQLKKAAAIAFIFLTGFFSNPLLAMKNVNSSGSNTQKSQSSSSVLAGCTPGVAQTDLDVNNVRARMLTGGDMWWDYSANQHGQYEVPKGSGIMPIYAGAIWVGGFNGPNLYLAGQEYRASGNDWWPGPLDTTGAANITAATCLQYDKHYKITLKEVQDFASGSGPATSAIMNWPANGNTSIGQAKRLAPYFDYNQNGTYDPNSSDGTKSDYPLFDLSGAVGCGATNCVADDKLYGDESLWWVINDKGNIHTETQGTPLGLEVQIQAFGFTTNDAINDMTFYNYRIYNRSTITLDSTFIGIWCDADLGGATDDYVGCDVERGLGFCYNGDNFDGNYSGELGYGSTPAAVGIDFFRGPIATPNDGKDNNHDCQVDEPCEQAIMTYYTYFTNGASSGHGDPQNAPQYYNYLSGSWADGNPLYYGGLGYPPTSTSTPASYCFPGLTDQQYQWGIGGNCTNPGLAMPEWTEVTAGATPDDRRFVESAGPFRLLPGAVNVVTTGVVWARASSGGALASLNKLKYADTKAQALFENCFNLINGPDAPDLVVQEMDKKLILYLVNNPTSNNYQENYFEKDPYITSGTDTVWKFQGYKVYQLKDATVSATDLSNIDKARLIGTYDIKDGVKQIINYNLGIDPTPDALIPREMVAGTDNGIAHVIPVTTDLFAKGDSKIINHKTYYFMVMAYGYNPGELPPANNIDITKEYLPYIEGRRNIKIYTGIPHNYSPYTGGTEAHAEFGSGPRITRIEGTGNGGNILELTDGTVSSILASSTGRVLTPTYDYGKGPISVRVVDPLNVPEGYSFTLKFDGPVIATSNWTLTENTTGKVIYSDKSIDVLNEQLLLDWGLAISINQVTDPGNQLQPNGYLASSMTFADPAKKWLTGLADAEASSYYNWIRSGIATTPLADYAGLDDDQVYEGVIGGTWAPMALAAFTSGAFSTTNFHAGPSQSLFTPSLSDLASVDVVITSDKSKWTRCVVVEMCEVATKAEGSAKKQFKRRAPSVDKNGLKAGDAGYNSTDGNLVKATGMGWFPGYAINLETGERLNIAFGENSAYYGANYNHHGRDMIWNPTSDIFGKVPFPGLVSTDTTSVVFGGEHDIFIFGHNKDYTTADKINVPRYDNGHYIDSILSLNSETPNNSQLKNIYSDAMWVNIPLLVKGHSLLETDVTIRLRVSKAYDKGYSTATDLSATPQNNNLPMYTFSTDGIVTHTKDNEMAVSALDLINVVPNPYYAYSTYETNSFDNRIKITNLPEECTVSIYNLGGTLVRRIKKGETFTTHAAFNSELKDNVVKTWDGSLDWDLKNVAGSPVSSGVYLIHVEVPGVGERILKWFGVMRPADLGSF